MKSHKIPISLEPKIKMVERLNERVKRLSIHFKSNPAHFHDFHARKTLERLIQKRASVLKEIRNQESEKEN